MNRRRLSFFLQEGPVVVFTTSAEPPWNVTSVSSNIERHLGYSIEHVLNTPNFLWEVIIPEDRAEGLRNAEAMETVGRATHVCRMRRMDGTIVWVKGDFHLVRDDQGVPIEIVGFLSDQTELGRAKAILTALPDSIVEVNEEGVISFFHALPEKTAMDPERAIGRPVQEFLPPDAGGLLLNAIRRTISTQTPQFIKFIVNGNDGEYRHFQANLGPSMVTRTAVVIIREITDEVFQEKVLSEQKRYLEEANDSLEQFVYVVSHDLREPLTGVAGFANLLKNRFSEVLGPQGGRFAQEIVQGTKNMEAKIDDLLALSRLNRGKPPTDFSLITAFESGKRCLVGVLREVPVKFIVPANAPLARGDAGQFNQVFQNLISNAVKYRSPDQEVVVELSIDVDPTNPTLLSVSVKDNGIGFDMKHASRIFGVFQRLYRSEQYPGTGIGLAIVKKVVDRHGGKAWATSTPGGGATFNFTVPRAF